MTNTTTTTGVTTLKQLQKECLKIDLTKVRYKRGFRPVRWSNDPVFVPDAPLTYHDLNVDGDWREGKNPHMKFAAIGGWYGDDDFDFIIHPITKPKQDGSTFIYKFEGGVCYLHYDFTDAQILVNKSTDEILGVLYALDNDYLNEWLRQTIDPNIPNNYDELHAQKEFEVLIATTTYSQEKVVGRSYEECVETLQQNDPKINAVTSSHIYRFSGMKTTSKWEGGEPIPSSYEEWVSLQEKEVA